MTTITNLVTNPSLETTSSSWSAQTSSFATSTNWAQFGTRSLNVTSSPCQ